MATQVIEPQSRHWTLAEYYQLAEQGWFQGQRVQLIEGEIIQMPPQGHDHFKSLSLVSRWLEQICGKRYWVRIQGPLNTMSGSDPEPDIAVVRGSIDQYHGHPQTAVLVVEVADSSLRLDRRKIEIYAAAGVDEYWIVNLAGRCVEVHRDLEAGSATYASQKIVSENDTISPLIMNDARISVAELLP